MKLLSIDFDYFIDANKEVRDKLFPEGADEVTKLESERKWRECYKKNPEIRLIGLIEEYNMFMDNISNYIKENTKIIITDSHKGIRELIPEGSLEVLNIDFHHDYYHYFSSGDSYNCGNWVRRLLEEKPETKISWVGQDTSETVALDGEIPFKYSTNLKDELDILGEADLIFLCLSPEWTPPHLNSMYSKLKKEIDKIETIRI